MMKIKKILTSNGFVTSGVMFLLIVGVFFEFGPLMRLELMLYDAMLSLKKEKTDSPVTLIAIDEKSVKTLGDWPFPRSLYADAIKYVSEKGADSIGFTELFTQKRNPLTSKNLNYLKKQTKSILPGKNQDMDQILEDASIYFTGEEKIIQSVRAATNAVFPFFFDFCKDGPPLPSEKLSKRLKQNSLLIPNNDEADNALFQKGMSWIHIDKRMGREVCKISETYHDLAIRAGALGHINLFPDMDGLVRSVPLLIQYKGRVFPSFVLQLALKYGGQNFQHLTAARKSLNSGIVNIENFRMTTDAAFNLKIDFSYKEKAIPVISFSDVVERKTSAAFIKNKVIIFGTTIERVTPHYTIPQMKNTSALEIFGSAIASVIEQTHLARPFWALPLEVIVILYFGFFIILFVPRIHFSLSAMILGSFLVVWSAIILICFFIFDLWIWLLSPFFLSIFSYFYVVSSKIRAQRIDEKIELNSKLGLAYQNQGLLDLAYDRFKRCPIEKRGIQDLIFNLGLDYERKRMFNKALNIYEMILEKTHRKDIREKVTNLRHQSSPSFHQNGMSSAISAQMMEGQMERPVFGRYEIIRELGQGAMGTVYLGSDPKINRKVAIKTLRYQSVDPDELDEVKTRFFREAEAAGRLSHPNIVTVYDIGEEHDIAYIAMEFLDGDDLAIYCRGENLLPIPRVLEILSAVLDALRYAHKEGIVHRDIKPANIMLLKDGQVKVTDFGIARIMGTSKTQTGIVLGTPSYMSPEQVAGKRVDGRSDLFSLGTLFYELLTGDRPFKGENLTALMFAITHANYTPIDEISDEIPPCCILLVKKFLSKNLTSRFKNTEKAFVEVNNCLKEIMA